MKTPNLFDVPKDRPTRREKIEALKKKYGIWTYRGPDAWAAMLEHDARREYGESKDTPVDLIARFCTLLEDVGMLVTGPTQVEAIRTLCSQNHIRCDL